MIMVVDLGGYRYCFFSTLSGLVQHTDMMPWFTDWSEYAENLRIWRYGTD